MKKKIIWIASLSAVFVLLLTLALLGKFVWGWFDEQEEEPYIRPDLELGESYYYFAGSEIRDVVLIFPQYERSDIYRIRIKNTKGENYFFLNTQTETDDYFLLGECDEDGNFNNEDVYYPPITGAMPNFSYSTLYDDTSKIPQLLAVAGALSISERIYPEEGDKLTDAQLAKYGLLATGDYEPAYFEILAYARDPETGYYLYTPVDGSGEIVRYVDGKYYYWGENNERGEEYTAGLKTLIPVADNSASGKRRVYVGNPTVDDSGYYIYLEGRDIIYTTTSPYIADIMGHDIGYYVAPQLVAQSDANYSYRLTPGFSMSEGSYISQDGKLIPAGATIGIRTDEIAHQESNGGVSDGEKNVFSIIDMSEARYAAFAAALSGKAVGDTVDVLVPNNALAKVGESVYYDIFRIRGIMKDTRYLENTGDVITGDEKIVVAYTDGTLSPLGGLQSFLGYIDLAASTTPEELRQKLIGKTVSEERYNDIGYLKTYDSNKDSLYTITFGVTAIKSAVDADGKSVKKADYGTTVTFSYRLLTDGDLTTETTMTLTIPAAGDGEGQFGNEDTWIDMAVKWMENAGYTNITMGQNTDKTAYMLRHVASGLLGKSVGSTVNSKNESTLQINVPYAIEVIYDYDLYDNAKVEYCVDYHETLSFAFSNQSDNFYRSTLYQINTPGKTMYSLDTTMTDRVLGLFENLQGDETVAIGIDDETIDRYGLYAHRLHFIMPYDCYSQDIGDKTYYYAGYEVGFDLYISDVQADGSRYVASTQYNTVVRVEDGSMFDFLDWSFSAKWMQNSMMMVSYLHLRRMVIDMNFAEEDGEAYNSIWGFDITVDPKFRYPTSDGGYEEMGRLYAAVVRLGSHLGQQGYTALNGLMTYDTTTFNPQKDNYVTLAGQLARVITDTVGTQSVLSNEGWRDLDAVYGDVLSSNQVDKQGSANMRTLLQILNAISYSGESAEKWSDEEIASIRSGEYTMRIALTLLDQSEKNAKEQGYTLTFYNRGVNALVVVEKINEDGTVGATSSLFYIRSREVFKIAQSVIELTQGVNLEPDRY